MHNYMVHLHPFNAGGVCQLFHCFHGYCLPISLFPWPLLAYFTVCMQVVAIKWVSSSHGNGRMVDVFLWLLLTHFTVPILVSMATTYPCDVGPRNCGWLVQPMQQQVLYSAGAVHCTSQPREDQVICTRDERWKGDIERDVDGRAHWVNAKVKGGCSILEVRAVHLGLAPFSLCPYIYLPACSALLCLRTALVVLP